MAGVALAAAWAWTAAAQESEEALKKGAGTKAYAEAHPQGAAAAPLRGRMVPLAEFESQANVYLSLPQDAPTGGIVLIHEWWGLNDHIKGLADGFAADGYVALAVDLYDGKTAATAQEAEQLMKSVNDKGALVQLVAAVRYLKEEPRVRVPKVGVVGWCMGGGYALKAAIDYPRIDACAMFYGPVEEDPARLAMIRAPVLGIFGKADQWIRREAVERFRAALKANQHPATIVLYEADHAFANPSSPNYNGTYAADARKRVREFFAANLVVRGEGEE